MNKITIEKIKLFVPSFEKLEVASISNNGSTIGFHTNAMSSNQLPLGSGCSSELKTSKAIAIAEMLERAIFRKLKQSESAPLLKLDSYPTSCGFAFGFEQSDTTQRAIFEAIERWTWSQWIDYQHGIASFKDAKLSSLASYFQSFFDKTHFYLREQRIFIPEVGLIDVNIGIVLGIKDNGIFPGSKVCLKHDNPWEHASIESWRHLLIARNSKEQSPVIDRIKYFAQNKQEAFHQIPKNSTTSWPSPKLSLLKAISVPEVSGFMCRALCSDYVSWHDGGERRFVY